MSADTLSAIATSIAGMSPLDYSFLLFKMGGIVVGAIGSLVAFAAMFLKIATSIWGALLKRIQFDLSSSFVTPAQLKDVVKELTDELREGDERMERIEDTAHETRKALERYERRVNRIFELLAAGGAHGVPTSPAAALRTAMESDDSIFPLGERLPPVRGGHV